MLKSIGIGNELLHELIESNSYYVDKTKFIKQFLKKILQMSCSLPGQDVLVKHLLCPPSMIFWLLNLISPEMSLG